MLLKLIKPISYGIVGSIAFPFVILGSVPKIHERYQNLVADHIQRNIKSPKLCAVLRICWEFPATMYYANASFWGVLNKFSTNQSDLNNDSENLIIVAGVVFAPCAIFFPVSLLSCVLIDKIDENAIHEMESMLDHNYWSG